MSTEEEVKERLHEVGELIGESVPMLDEHGALRPDEEIVRHVARVVEHQGYKLAGFLRDGNTLKFALAEDVREITITIEGQDDLSDTAAVAALPPEEGAPDGS